MCGVKGWSEGSPSYPSPRGEQLCAASRVGVKVLAESSPSPWEEGQGEGSVRGLRLNPSPGGEQLCCGVKR